MSDHQTQEAYDEMHARIHQSGNVVVSRIDIETIEILSDATIRSGDTQTALEGYALALRLRSETGFHPKRRSTDAVT